MHRARFRRDSCRNRLSCVRLGVPGGRSRRRHEPEVQRLASHSSLRRRTHLMIDPQPTVLSLTDAAASKLAELTKEETNPDIGLRVYVYSGGCSGYRYGMMLEDAPTAEDNVLQANGVKVYVDG